MRGKRLESWASQHWRGRVPSPTSTAAQLPAAVGTHWCSLEATVMCITFPTGSGFSAPVGLAAIVRGPGLQHLCCSLGSACSVCFSSPTFWCPDVQSYPTSCSVGESTFVELWMFTGCRLKWGNKGSFSFCHASEIILFNKTFKNCLLFQMLSSTWSFFVVVVYL